MASAGHQGAVMPRRRGELFRSSRETPSLQTATFRVDIWKLSISLTFQGQIPLKGICLVFFPLGIEDSYSFYKIVMMVMNTPKLMLSALRAHNSWRI